MGLTRTDRSVSVCQPEEAEAAAAAAAASSKLYSIIPRNVFSGQALCLITEYRGRKVGISRRSSLYTHVPGIGPQMLVFRLPLTAYRSNTRDGLTPETKLASVEAT